MRAHVAACTLGQSLEAKELGADAVLVAPIGMQNDAILHDFHRSVVEAT